MIYSIYLLIYYLSILSEFKLFSCSLIPHSFKESGEAIDHFKGYSEADKRVFLFDYDGTLTDGKINPEDKLQKLLEDPKNHIYIVTARTAENIQKQMPRIKSERFFFVGEHGGVLKRSTAYTSAGPTEFGLYCKNALQKFIDKLKSEGSIPKDVDFETGATGHLTFGFRLKNLDDKSWYQVIVDKLKMEINESGETVKGLNLGDLQNAELNELNGYKVEFLKKIDYVSLQPKNLHKGTFVQQLLEELKEEGLKLYVLGMGNDLPDEPFYRAMHNNGFSNTVRVGNDIKLDESVAKHHLKSPQKVMEFLEELTSIQ
ncbi:HAD-like domain-containing protein [Phakopsora pachyrhizi]|nr:HAD-like domain-containing protein [Phakopsora pachyrhizi]